MPPEDWVPAWTEFTFEGWMSDGLEIRIKMARKGICLVRHGWFNHTIDTNVQPMQQNG